MDLETVNIQKSSHEGVENLKGLMDKANEFNVEREYLDTAEKLSG